MSELSYEDKINMLTGCKQINFMYKLLFCRHKCFFYLKIIFKYIKKTLKMQNKDMRVDLL